MGWRSDLELGERASLTIQGDVYSGTEEETRISLSGTATDEDVDVEGGNLLARYRREFSPTSSAVMHVYFDRTSQTDSTFRDARNTYDLDFQHSFAPGGHEVLWGLGFRYIDNDTSHTGDSFAFALDPADREDRIFSLFAQDEFHPVDPRFSITIGAKYEHNDYTGSEFQPSGKMSFSFAESQMLWLSLSRAVSTPSRTASDAYLDLSRFSDPSECRMVGGQYDPQRGCIITISEEGIDSNAFVSYEVGYRTKIGDSLFIDNALFYDDHTDHNTESRKVDYLYGYELSLRYQPTKRWRLQAAYTFHDGENDESETEAPLDIANHRVHLRSYLNVTEHVDFDVMLFYVDETGKVDDYAILDVRVEWRPVKNVALSLLVTNLPDNTHVEGRTDSTRANTVREPAAIGKLTWRF
jgi:iron complex outermembrane receptor protein